MGSFVVLFSACRGYKAFGLTAEEEEEEMRVRMRQAQRQMKGTKLQYLDQQPVLFSDVAGVPGAKVRSGCWFCFLVTIGFRHPSLVLPG